MSVLKGVAAGGEGGGSSLPDQTGQGGKFLTTDGTTPSWGTPAGGGGVTISQATVNFGAFGYAASVSIPDPTVTSATRVMVSVAGTGGRDADELEFSHLSVAAIVTDGVGYDIIATAPLGADGQFNINHFKN